MAEIRPFRGLRYTETAGRIEDLVAPPYDQLDATDRESYAAKSPHNVVHLTRPEARTDDRSKFVRYARAAALLAEWRREGVLAPEAAPVLYRTSQKFGKRERTGLVALMRLEPYGDGVRPTERTVVSHRDDRLRVLESSRAHLEPIFGLFEDPDGAVGDAVAGAASVGGVEVDAEGGVTHRLEPITDPAAVDRLVRLLADRPVFLADGHHRYEAALAHREAMGERDGPVPEDYILVALTSTDDPGLATQTVHVVLERPAVDPYALAAALADRYDVEETHSSRLGERVRHARGEGRRAVGLATEGGRGFALVRREPTDALGMALLADEILPAAGARYGDGTVLLEDAHLAVRAADSGNGVAFVLDAPTMGDLRRTALSGGRAPSGAFAYAPSLLSGLVLWSLADA